MLLMLKAKSSTNQQKPRASLLFPVSSRRSFAQFTQRTNHCDLTNKVHFIQLPLKAKITGRRRLVLGQYIEDITRWGEDMNFTFEWQEKYLTGESFRAVTSKLKQRQDGTFKMILL